MKANEFVKLVGLTEAKRVIRDNEIKGRYRHRNVCHVELVELYGMVKSHELVDSVGGLDAANRIVCDAFHGSNGDIPEGHEKLSLAIQDVESCQ